MGWCWYIRMVKHARESAFEQMKALAKLFFQHFHGATATLGFQNCFHFHVMLTGTKVRLHAALEMKACISGLARDTIVLLDGAELNEFQSSLKKVAVDVSCNDLIPVAIPVIVLLLQ